MIANIRNIYQLKAYLQVQKILCLLIVMAYVKALKASGIVNIKPITDATVTYIPVEGGGSVTGTENIGNGKYQTRYTTGTEPAVNKIEAEGEAKITVPEVFYDPITNKAITEGYEKPPLPLREVTLKAGQEVLFDKDTKEPIKTGSYQKIKYTVYGVNVSLTIDPEVILLNEDGYTVEETTFRYNILPDCTPSETETCVTEDGQPKAYNAILSDIDLFEIDKNKKESWMGYLVGNNTQGQGASVLVAGSSEFDINKKYEAEAVLNRGSDVEIRSGIEKEIQGEKKIKRTDIILAQIKVLDDKPSEVKEIKFGDGSKAEKVYHIELISKSLTETCQSLTGKLRLINRKGLPITAPDATKYYPSAYPLKFLLSETKDKCIVKIIEDPQAEPKIIKNKFIISNLSRTALASRKTDLNNILPLYSGIGNVVEVEIKGAKIEIPIEPVGIIVIGIDGLRQDVLYPDKMDDENFENVNEGNYFVDASTLAGLGQILIGDPESSTTQQYIMLSEVTSIFPSITLASWASVFTGEFPNKTGITGNEFFARDLYESGGWWNIPGMWNHGLPEGMITLANGGFPNNTLDYLVKNLLPAHDYSHTVAEKEENSSPVNVLSSDVQTIYEWIRDDDEISRFYKDTNNCMSGGECRSVVFFNHQGRGADWWGTVDLAWWEKLGVDVTKLGELFRKVFGTPIKASKKLDETPTEEALRFLEDYYNLSETQEDKRFPALFVIYYGGPDHYAHDIGLDGSAGGYTGYSDYFKKYTDQKIKEVMDKLKELDELDNKIFIITADHGHTDMPWDYTVPIEDPSTGELKDVTPDTSCELKLEGFNKRKVQEPELANNNLHLWELGEVLKLMPTGEVTLDGKKLYYKVLTPTEIVKANKGETTTNDSKQADIIAAFNGPMAHIYVKGGNGWDDNPQSEFLIKVTDLLSASLAEGDGPIPRLGSSIDAILIRLSRNSEYAVYNGATYNAEGQITLNDPIPINTYFSDNSKYVNALNRINGMNNPDRSGDIILIFKDFTDDVPKNRYTSGSACKSWHGSLNRSDSYVPLIIAYPGGNRYELDLITQKVCTNNLCEGNWKVKDLITEIIETQYSGQ